MKTCQVCKKKKLKKIINFGKHPVCHKFNDGRFKTEKFPLELGQCKSCGLVQLTKFTSLLKLTPKYNWITYNEPEEHLDHLTKIISNLPGINKRSKMCGVSYKEDTLLVRLKSKGFKNTWRMDAKKDLQIINKNANLETIQSKINSKILNKIKNKYGLQDVIIVRHILEHTHNTLEFMSTLKKLVKKDGYIVFEVPDCAKGLKINDYNTLWEEHLLYFTRATLNNSLKLGGFKIKFIEKYTYPFESVLIAIVTPQKNIKKIKKNINLEILKKENRRVKFSKAKLLTKKRNLKIFLKKMKKNNNKIAIFGTGHSACLFINLFQLNNFIDFAIDDNKKKIGYCIPGSDIKIYDSKILKNENIKLCLLGMNFESEKKILKKYNSFKKNGCKFASIYPSSKYAINI